MDITATEASILNFLIQRIEKFGCGDEYAQVMLRTHSWFIPTKKLIEHFRLLHQSDHTTSAFICEIIKFWLQYFPENLSESDVFDLEKLVKALSSKEQCKNIFDNVFNELKKNECPTSLLNQCGNRRASMAIQNLDADNIAECLTFLDLSKLKNIKLPELKEYTKTGSLVNCPNLNRLIKLSNGICKWVQCMILKCCNTNERCRTLCKFIDIAENLKRKNNYNALMAIVGGICHSSIIRLQKTFALLTPADKKKIQYLQQVLSPNANYANYRQHFAESTDPKIPIVAIILKDLTFYDITIPDQTNQKNMFEFRKLLQIDNLMKLVWNVQRAHLNFQDTQKNLADVLLVSFNLTYDENNLYELSLRREPKANSNVRRNSGDSIWDDIMTTPRLLPIDEEAVEEDFEKMIKSVFDNYDQNHDGYISKNEFEDIQKNFPFIQSFAFIDCNKDGKISREEIRKYFSVQSNYFVLRWTFGHTFKITTFRRPKLCNHCNALLWGLVRQGLQCTDCGLIVHRQCMDVVVRECQRRDGRNS